MRSARQNPALQDLGQFRLDLLRVLRKVEPGDAIPPSELGSLGGLVHF